MAWSKINIQKEDGTSADAQAPVIVSASRSTDIPAFYADWFFHRLKMGYSAWTNPFNGVKTYVTYHNMRFIVFWSKNPKPLLKHLDYLAQQKIGCYIQYTLNDYVAEGLEKGVPNLEERIETFQELADKLGKGRVIWRFDPLILTDSIDIDRLLHKIEYIGDKLYGYTEKLVFSFADIGSYRKVKSNLEKNQISYTEWTESMMFEFAKRLSVLNKKWDYELATCGEKIDIEQFGIKHNHCIDQDLIVRFAHNDPKLMAFLGVQIQQQQGNLFGGSQMPSGALELGHGLYAVKAKSNQDKGQRPLCGCMSSKDIGEYNTCPHLCEYCYANTSKEGAANNYRTHKEHPLAETITGR